MQWSDPWLSRLLALTARRSNQSARSYPPWNRKIIKPQKHAKTDRTCKRRLYLNRGRSGRLRLALRTNEYTKYTDSPSYITYMWKDRLQNIRDKCIAHELRYVGIRCRTAKRYNTENSKQIFPEKKLRNFSPNFHIHVCMCNLYIPMIGLPFLLQENIWTDPGNT